MRKETIIRSILIFVCLCVSILLMCTRPVVADSKELGGVPKVLTVYTGEKLDITSRLNLPCNFEHVDEEDMWILESLDVSSSNQLLTILTNQDTSDDTSWEERYGFIVGNKTGKCTVTFKYVRNKTTYYEVYNEETQEYETNSKNERYEESEKCTVLIKRRSELKIASDLFFYDTRDKRYDVCLKNLTNKTITVYSKGAKSVDSDYKKFDRKLKLIGNKKYIKIKPGKRKRVSFKILGRNTWPIIKDTLLDFYIKHNKKKINIYIDTTGAYKYTKKDAISLAPINELEDW